MKITITLTAAELQGIRAYMNEVDLPTNEASIESEIRMRLYSALRDPREAISDHILKAESDFEKDQN
jgi:hypothetical protein